MLNNETLNKINQARAEGKTIGLVQGSWDLFHLGHLKYIKEARKQCEFLIVSMDSDEKIKKRKGSSRPIIPEDERKAFIELLEIADAVVVKQIDEPKWNLIKTVKPDVLIAIKENYTDEQVGKLEEICGRVTILPRQSESSTSDKIRKIIIAERMRNVVSHVEDLKRAIEDFKARINYNDSMPEEVKMLIEHLNEATDWVVPVCVGYCHNGKWYFGTNKVDFSLSTFDIENRTELYYSTTEHAEINLLKQLDGVEKLNGPLWLTLFPCDKCLKTLIDKGLKEFYYLEDHPNRNWSKRAHNMVKKYGIKAIKLIPDMERDDLLANDEVVNMNSFNFIYPPNARHQEQLDIMMDLEGKNEDPLDQAFINQEIIINSEYWYVTRNKFPYEGAEQHFLIVAQKPVLSIDDMPKEMWADFMVIFNELKESYGMSGGGICMRFGDCALSGASLKRIHAHVIMPRDEEKVRFPVGGHKELKKGLYLHKPE
ncbi:MAG: adenylyltransferase/cytidyltransferase family protein [Ruminococcus sp.]|nr:adenylyltransferase/cytidyltransferase family protein [Ruminococcus sp.]